jgi:uncharacterized membrane protein YeaQ/YmgE (transglycosylase-associated protein family)
MGWAIFIIWCVLATVVASWIGYSVKGRPLTGFLLGIALGWVGVLVIALVPPTAEKRVQRRLRDDAVTLEVQRRKMGAEPWSADTWTAEAPPAGGERQFLS